MHQHNNALRLLSLQPLQPWLGPGDFRSAKDITKSVLGYNGFGWPPNEILDVDLYVKYIQMVADGSENQPGVRYDTTMVK